MADLVTRLILNDSQFNDTIRSRRQELSSFKNLSSTVGNALKGFAGQLGLAVGAYELLTTAINSNRDTQIEWQSIVNGAKQSVNQFFTALTSGDWSVFENGLINAIGLAKEYQKQMKLAQDASLWGKTKAEKYEAQRNNYEYLITSEHTSKTQKQTAFDKYKELTESEIRERIETNNYLFQSIAKGLESVNVKSLKTVEEVEKAMLDYLDPKTAQYKELEAYKQQKKDLSGKVSLGRHLMTDANSYDAGLDMYNKSLQKLKEIQSDYLDEMARFQNFYNDESNSEMRDFIDAINENIDKIGTARKDLDDARADLESALAETEDNNGLKITPKVEVPEQSLAELEQKISGLQTQIKLAVDPESRTRLYQELQALTEKKRVIEFQYKHSTAPTLNPSRLSLTDLAQKPDLTEKIPTFTNPIKAEDIKLNNDYAESLTAIASIMGNISSATNESAAAYLGWASNLLSAIAAAIPAIEALTAAKSNEAVASGVASASQTPVVGWLLAGAAAAAVIAALASAPKFASGGIVGGNSTIGDKVLARVNSGEMILNQHQQRNLFNLLDGNTSKGGVSSGDVKFRIEGKELVGVLSNYNNKISKLR